MPCQRLLAALKFSYNDKVLLAVDTGISFSEDPSIRFTFTPSEAGVLKADVKDTKDQEFTLSKKI